MPGTLEDYVHRIGRTGRAGKTGTAISFFTDKNAKMARELVSLIRDAGQPVPEDLLKFVGGLLRFCSDFNFDFDYYYYH
jgi:ATP-dependent RNA helicase DDX5/DBP2